MSDNDCPPPSRQGRSRIARPFMGGNAAQRRPIPDESPADESAGYARASLTGRGRRENAGAFNGTPLRLPALQVLDGFLQFFQIALRLRVRGVLRGEPRRDGQRLLIPLPRRVRLFEGFLNRA